MLSLEVEKLLIDEEWSAISVLTDTIVSKIKIGCSGFLYKDWRGNFYPENLSQVNWFDYYAGYFDCIELNITFHRHLKKETFYKWYNETPEDFSMCLKGSRFITHVKKLKDVEMPTESFFNSAAPLKEKLKVVLWQLPSHIRYNYKSLEEFVRLIVPYKAKHAFEFRHESWITEKVVDLLHSENIALCMADCPGHLKDLPLTADFVYIRRHGRECTYSTSYTDEELEGDARRLMMYAEQDKQVYMFFNNDVSAYAPKNALTLLKMIQHG